MLKGFIFFAVFLFPMIGHATVITCGFFVENDPNGKSNEASCGMSPEKVFSSRNSHPDPWEHCDVEKPYAMNEIHDMRVDIPKGVVTWTSKNGLTDHGKIRQKKYYIKKGKNAEVAENSVNRIRTQNESFQILSTNTFMRRIFFDPITRKIYKPAKRVKQYLIVFGEGNYTYVLHAQENISEAILTDPAGNAENSWLHMRFGKCRVEN